MRQKNLGNAPRFRVHESRVLPGESGKGSTFIASTEDVDRFGDVVVQHGWKLGNFRRNPVLLLGHDYQIPAIGKVGRIDVEDLFSGVALVARDVRFSKTPLAQEVESLYRDGSMSAVSVGFLPLRARAMTEEDARRFGADRDSDRRGLVFEEAELLELSAVSVPALPSALIQRERSFSEAELEQTLTIARSIRKFDFGLAQRFENSVARVERYGLVCSAAPRSQACKKAEREIFDRVVRLASETVALAGRAEPADLAEELFSGDTESDPWQLEELHDELAAGDPIEEVAALAETVSRNLSQLG